MKMSDSEVRCDQCKSTIPVFFADGSQNRESIFVTIRGPGIGHRKFDFCDLECFRWFVAHESLA